MEQALQILIWLVLLAVVGVLGFGFYTLRRGGEFGRTWSNRLMRMRIGLQALAVVLLVIFVIVRAGHH
jgi:type II secretory pathway component PulF